MDLEAGKERADEGHVTDNRVRLPDWAALNCMRSAARGLAGFAGEVLTNPSLADMSDLFTQASSEGHAGEERKRVEHYTSNRGSDFEARFTLTLAQWHSA